MQLPVGPDELEEILDNPRAARTPMDRWDWLPVSIGLNVFVGLLVFLAWTLLTC